MFQGFVNKMTVIMKFSAMGPIDIPPWCNVCGVACGACSAMRVLTRIFASLSSADIASMDDIANT
jgi:hypothetical protein